MADQNLDPFDLPPGGSVTIEFEVAVDDPVPAGTDLLANQASLTAAGGIALSTIDPDKGTADDPNQAANDDPTDTAIAAAPDLVATKSVSDAVSGNNDGLAQPGETLTYEITVINIGDAGAANVVITDAAPSNTTFDDGSGAIVASTGASGAFATTNAGSLQVDVAELAGGGSITVSYSVTVAATFPAGAVSIDNVAQVEADGIPRFDSPPAVIPLDGAPDIGGGGGMAPLKTVSDAVSGNNDGLAQPGEVLTYSITVENTGTVGAANVTIADFAPPGTRYDDGSGIIVSSSFATGAVVSVDAGSLQVNVAELAAGGDITVSYTATVDRGDPTPPASIDNTAQISADGLPAIETNVASIAVQAPDLVVEKSVDDRTPLIGDPVVFSVEVANEGPGNATGVTVGDLLPGGLSFVGAVGDGTYDSATGVWDVGALPEGARASIDLTARVTPGASDPMGSGAFIDVFASGGVPNPLDEPGGMVFGPDGNLYVISVGTDEVLRYDGASGTFIDTFAVGGGLSAPRDLMFGPDGNLYVTSTGSDEVLRYDGATGVFIDVFVGGVDNPFGLVFGPDGNLYVASAGVAQTVLRYDGATGGFLGVFVAGGSGGLDFPRGLVFGPGGDLYVASFDSDEVLRYDGASGAFLDDFVAASSGGLDGPVHVTFGPDGHLYVSSLQSNEVLRYEGASGAFLDAFVVAASGGLFLPTGLGFGADGNLYVSSFVGDQVLRYDGFLTNRARLTGLDQTDPNAINDTAFAGVDYGKLDFGDAPDPRYPTLLASDGARHAGGGATLSLGALWDAEVDGQPDAGATGDDVADSDDEDGVTFLTPLVAGKTDAAAEVVVAGAGGLLNAWVDFDGDGDWAGPGEQIAADLPVGPGANALTFAVPGNAVGGVTYARFRLDTGGALAPAGLAPDGEVEDLQVGIQVPGIAVTKTAAPTSVAETGGPVTFTVQVDNTGTADLTLSGLSDDVHGDVTLVQGSVQSTDCVLPQTVAPQGSYACSFTALVGGNAGTAETDTVTAAGDFAGVPVSAAGSATVTFTDVAPAPSVTKAASPTSVAEPGGPVTFTVRVENTSPGETASLTALSDDVHGDLNGRGDCAVPQDIAAGSAYQCSFTATVTGNAGDRETDTVSATVEDDEGNAVTGLASATVTLDDVLPGISVTKSADPGSLPEPGGQVTFSVRVDNTSPAEALSLSALLDDVHGDLNGRGDCAVPQDIAAGSAYQCSFTATVTGVAGDSEIDTVSATVEDDEGNSVTGQASATVAITAPARFVLTADDGGAVAVPGGSVAYRLGYANEGSQAIGGAQLLVRVPDFVKPNPALSTPGWVCVPGGAAGIECTLALGTLGAGAVGQALFVVDLPAVIPAGAERIDLMASLLGDTGQPAVLQGARTGAAKADRPRSRIAATEVLATAEISTPLEAAPDLLLAIEESGSGDTPRPGDTLVCEIDYGNLGDQDAGDVTITGNLPAEVSFRADQSSPGWSCAAVAQGTECTLAVGPLPADPGAAATVLLAMELGNRIGPELAVGAAIGDVSGEDANPADNTDTKVLAVGAGGGTGDEPVPVPTLNVLGLLLLSVLLGLMARSSGGGSRRPRGGR